LAVNDLHRRSVSGSCKDCDTVCGTGEVLRLQRQLSQRAQERADKQACCTRDATILSRACRKMPLLVPQNSVFDHLKSRFPGPQKPLKNRNFFSIWYNAGGVRRDGRAGGERSVKESRSDLDGQLFCGDPLDCLLPILAST
jgi:hypothetical protein